MLEDLLQFWFGQAKWFVAFAIGFGILTLFSPCNRGMTWWRTRQQVMSDLWYWFVVPLISRTFRIALFIVVFAVAFGTLDTEGISQSWSHGFGPAGELPLWGQILLVLLIQDFVLYWLHRAFHTNAAWRYHAIHHSVEELDWTASMHFHPVNFLFQFCVADVFVILLGFPGSALAAMAAVNTIYSAMVHANLNWTFGPFKYLLASPVFHRWHHSHPSEGGNKNFASTFPFIDLLFGTFYMPKGRLPEDFGVTDPNFPSDFIGQMKYPIAKRLK